MTTSAYGQRFISLMDTLLIIKVNVEMARTSKLTGVSSSVVDENVPSLISSTHGRVSSVTLRLNHVPVPSLPPNAYSSSPPHGIPCCRVRAVNQASSSAAMYEDVGKHTRCLLHSLMKNTNLNEMCSLPSCQPGNGYKITCVSLSHHHRVLRFHMDDRESSARIGNVPERSPTASV